MNFKKFLSLLCTVTMLFSSTFCCKAEKPTYYDMTFLGSTNTGKTQIIRRLHSLSFEQEYIPTTHTGLHIKRLNDNTKDTRCFTWEPVATFKFRPPIFKGKTVLGIIVCDLNNQKTINSFGEWIQIYKGHAGNNNVILVGNKSDLIDEKELETKKQTLIELVRQHDIPEPERRVVLVSAKTEDGIENLKELIIEFTPELTQDIPEPK